MGETLAEGDIYTATIPRSRKSPRQYSVVHVSGNQLVLRYGWFAFADGVSASPQDLWTWSPQGVFRLSQFEFNVTQRLGPTPSEGDSRADHPWS